MRVSPPPAATVNATAMIAGIVPSTGTGTTQNSGGAMNFPRLLEDWRSATLTLNTSIVCLYSSTWATGRFLIPGNYYYAPATRNFAFDQNYTISAKMPPGTPNICRLIRATLEQSAAGSHKLHAFTNPGLCIPVEFHAPFKINPGSVFSVNARGPCPWADGPEFPSEEPLGVTVEREPLNTVEPVFRAFLTVGNDKSYASCCLKNTGWRGCRARTAAVPESPGGAIPSLLSLSLTRGRTVQWRSIRTDTRKCCPSGIRAGNSCWSSRGPPAEIRVRFTMWSGTVRAACR